MSNTQIYENLALEGGGAKGHIYMGAALELERLGILPNLKAISGASVGAIAALLFATGWPVSKIQERYAKMDPGKMAMGGILDKLWVPFNVVNHFGAFDGRAFHTWLKEIVKEVTGDENTTFKQWHALKEQKPELKLKDLFIEACNLETRYNETFSHLSEHADVPIADAIFASMKFPGFFTMAEIKNTLYIDGGTQRNCPSQVFEEKPGTFNPKTLSIRLDNQDQINYYEKGIKPHKRRPKTILQALGAIIEAATNAQDFSFNTDRYKEHTMFATTFDFETLDFDLTEEQKNQLLESGRYSVKCYFHKHHPELTAGKYDPSFLANLEAFNYPLTISDYNAYVSPRGKPCHIAKFDAKPRGKQRVRDQILTTAAAITPLHDMKANVVKPVANTTERELDNEKRVSAKR